MFESRKTNALRGDEFLRTYLSGKVIDIGAGEDLVCEGAERFDLDEGDANCVTRYRKTESYDAVHSSHCLEHMFDPILTLGDWWSLIRPHGYLVLVVPDEDLYEQGFWPSRFNADHKWTFRLNKKESWSPVSIDIERAVAALPGVEVISVSRQDHNYDYRLQTLHGQRRLDLQRFSLIRKSFDLSTAFLRRVLRRLGMKENVREAFLKRLEFKVFGTPIDQTIGEALAQIQVVARKLPKTAN